MVVKTLKPQSGPMDHLVALSALLKDASANPSRLFERGLDLLVKSLGVDRALITQLTGLGQEVFWWALGPEATMDGIIEAPEKGFCPILLDHPEGLLVVPDASLDPDWNQSPAYLDLGIRAYAGIALRAGGKTLGTLCVQHRAPREFDPAELAYLRILGHLVARTVESENLKQELRGATEALELSGAVLEDSALQSVRSGLPNRRYLDIWIKASLFMLRRRKEPMAIALWTQPMVMGTKGMLAAAAGQLRGEDLLVELSGDQYLLLMPHTMDSGAEVVLGRLRETLGFRPTGATLWLPDGKDMTLKSTLQRAVQAFTEASRSGSALVWNRG